MGIELRAVDIGVLQRVGILQARCEAEDLPIASGYHDEGVEPIVLAGFERAWIDAVELALDVDGLALQRDPPAKLVIGTQANVSGGVIEMLGVGLFLSYAAEDL